MGPPRLCPPPAPTCQHAIHGQHKLLERLGVGCPHAARRRQQRLGSRSTHGAVGPQRCAAAAQQAQRAGPARGVAAGHVWQAGAGAAQNAFYLQGQAGALVIPHLSELMLFKGSPDHGLGAQREPN